MDVPDSRGVHNALTGEAITALIWMLVGITVLLIVVWIVA